MAGPYKIKPLVKTDTRNFWKGDSAKSYVTSLPKEWVEEYIPDYTKKENREINLSQIGRTLLITPKKNGEKKVSKSLDLTITNDSADQVYYSVISAYLQNYDEVRITEKNYDSSLIAKLQAIDSKLPGADFKGKVGNENYLITFDTKIENIPKKLDEIYTHYLTMYSKNEAMFKNSMEELDVQIEHNIVTKTEAQVDNKVFGLKRLFTHVFHKLLDEPTILLETGLLKDKDDIDYTAAYKIAGYRSVANALERTTDIQKDIFELLKDLREDKTVLPKAKNYGFDKYYEAAHKIMVDAYTSKKVVENDECPKDGFDCLLKVLSAENNEKDDVCYRDKYISFDDRSKILALVKESKSPTIGALEGLIWGSTGLATNIAETWINMSDLPKINGYVADKGKKKK